MRLQTAEAKLETMTTIRDRIQRMTAEAKLAELLVTTVLLCKEKKLN